MSVEIAWKQNILVTDFHLLKSPLVVFGFGSQAFICGFSRQNIYSVDKETIQGEETIQGRKLYEEVRYKKNNIINSNLIEL